MATKPKTLDLFNGVIPALDTRNKKYYEDLADEQKKEFDPWVSQRFLSSAEHSSNEIIEHYLIMTNDIVNVNFTDVVNFNNKDNKEMMWKLMSMVGIGKSLGKYGHPFIAPSKKRTYENAFKQWLFDTNKEINDQELEILFKSFTKETAKDLLEQYQIKDKKIIKSLNDL